MEYLVYSSITIKTINIITVKVLRTTKIFFHFGPPGTETLPFIWMHNHQILPTYFLCLQLATSARITEYSWPELGNRSDSGKCILVALASAAPSRFHGQPCYCCQEPQLGVNEGPMTETMSFDGVGCGPHCIFPIGSCFFVSWVVSCWGSFQ